MSEGHFEAKISRRTESKDGVFITLNINPSDLTADLAMLRVGTALMVAWSEVVDTSVQPLDSVPLTNEEVGVLIEKSYGWLPEPVPTPAKDRRPFASLPLTQQAAMRSRDQAFIEFLLPDSPFADVGTSATEIRRRCGVESRVDIVKNTPAGDKWEQIEKDYQSWLVTSRYQGSIR